MADKNELGAFASTIFKRTYQFSPEEDWAGCARRVSKFVANGNKDLEEKFFNIIHQRKFMPGGRYLYAAGRPIPQTTNCFLLKADDSREGWGFLANIAMQALMTGGGIGVDYSSIRPRGTPIKRYGGTASGPVSLMSMINEIARHVMAGGKRRSALWAGLNWLHPDIEEFIKAKDWTTNIKAMKEQDFNFPAILDMTNISVQLDKEFFKEYKKDEKVQDFYYRICKSMCKTGEPGFSIDFDNQTLRNPCTEVISSDNGDCCNLGSVNLSRIKDLNELEEVTRLGTRFLYMGTFQGWLPHELFQKVREKNRRIGLGLLGLHEWCILHNHEYGPSGELGRWLSVWQGTSDDEAKKVASEFNSVVSVGIRAVAPTGTIGILAESSTGIEPIFCTAYKRRFLAANQKWHYQYVIDPTVERLVQLGINSEDIEDSQTLSKDVERRIVMQTFVQDFVDQAISSTINLPEYGEVGNNNVKQFSLTLIKYLKKLRGITVYPNGSRPGQPITPIHYETAKKHRDVVYEESNECAQGICGL